jgi:hypothetical protein
MKQPLHVHVRATHALEESLITLKCARILQSHLSAKFFVLLYAVGEGIAYP